MKYLVLEVDVFGIPLREEDEPPGRTWPVRLSEQLQEALLDWNKRFSPLISSEHLYSTEDRKSQCVALNEEGTRLARRIAAEVSGGAKVRYVPEKM